MEEEDEILETEVEITAPTDATNDDEHKESHETEGEENTDLEKKKKKICVCNKIKQGNPEETEVECEECQELPPIEPTPILVETPPEVVQTEEEDFDVVIVDPNKQIETAEIGVATSDDLPDLFKENNELKSKLLSLSRENLQMDFKETQTDFPEITNVTQEVEDEDEGDDVVERETEAMRLMMERVKNRIALENESQVQTEVPPMNLEFEILLDFMKDPKNPSKTILSSSTVIKNPSDTKNNECDQSMILSVGNGKNGENGVNVEKGEKSEEKVLEPETSMEIDHEQDQVEKDDEEEESTTTDDDDTTTKVEVRDVATSMTEDFLEDLSIPDESLQDFSLPYEKCVQTETYTEVTYDNENEEINNETEVNEDDQEADDEYDEPQAGESKKEHVHYLVPDRSIFKELDSLVRGISMVYAHFEEILGRQGIPGTKHAYFNCFFADKSCVKINIHEKLSLSPRHVY